MPSYLSKDSPMACGICGKGIAECTCPDMDERLADLGGSTGVMIFRVDKGCGLHFARCHCDNPFWIYSNTGEEFVEANEMERQRGR